MTGPVETEFDEVPPAVLMVLADLRAHAQIAGRVGGAERIDLRKPTSTQGMWLWVRDAGGFAIRADRGAWSRTVQVEVCAGGLIGEARELPELAVDRLASVVIAHYTAMRAAIYAGASWRARYLDGPFDLTDTTRGADTPVIKRGVRLDVRLHAHV